MVRKACLIVASLIALVLCLPAHAALADEPVLKEATSAIVVDESGSTLWELDADREMGPASITKVMTAMVALDSGLDLDSRVKCVDIDLGWYSQTAGYKAGDTPTLRELLTVALVWSANDACYEIACGVAGSEEAFVELMNQKAAEIGLRHTHFVNCHGLDADGHYSCARDLATMGRYALDNYPFIAWAVQLEKVTVTIGKAELDLPTTHEPLLDYEGLLGIKTGSLVAGTSCFLGAAERGGLRVYTVVLGCPTTEGRFNDTRTLMDWAFANCRKVDLCRAGQLVREAPFAFDARFICPVGYLTDAHGIRILGSGPLTFSSTLMPEGTPIAPGMPYGVTFWRQGARPVASSGMAVGKPRPRPLAISPFSRALFGPQPMKSQGAL